MVLHINNTVFRGHQNEIKRSLKHIWYNLINTIKMKKTITLRIALICLLFINILQTKAQEDESIEFYKIKTVNGLVLEGSLVTSDGESVTLLTSFGEVKINRSEIKSQKLLKNFTLKDGEIWSENIQGSRYFWQPTGHGLRKGQGYYQNIWVFFNQATYAFTDKFSLSAGLIPTFLFGGEFEYTPFWIVPKFSLPIQEDKLSVGVGALIATIPDVFDDVGLAGIGFGTITLGGHDKNLSIGFGVPFADGEAAESILISFNGMVRIGDKGYLVAETIFSEGTGVGVFGGRTVWPNIALDYGLITPFVDDFGVVFPWLGFTIPF